MISLHASSPETNFTVSAIALAFKLELEIRVST